MGGASGSLTLAGGIEALRRIDANCLQQPVSDLSAEVTRFHERGSDEASKPLQRLTPPTASAASRPKPPLNTETRRNRACSPEVRREVAPNRWSPERFDGGVAAPCRRQPGRTTASEPALDLAHRENPSESRSEFDRQRYPLQSMAHPRDHRSVRLVEHELRTPAVGVLHEKVDGVGGLCRVGERLWGKRQWRNRPHRLPDSEETPAGGENPQVGARCQKARCQ